MSFRILVTGSNGQLGTSLQSKAKAYPSTVFLFTDRDTFSLDNPEQMEQLMVAFAPNLVVNAAAYTAVDAAETDKENAVAINATGVGSLAALCSKHNCQLMHISTDYVYDGNAVTPYLETDPTNPQNVYGKTKLNGERLALEANKDCVVIRTSWVFSPYGKNFVKTMLRLMDTKPSIGVVSDQFGCPTSAPDLAEALLTIAHQNNWHPGVYHFCNAGTTSWFEFAATIAKKTATNCAVNPIPTEAYPTPAKRPAYSVLDTQKIQTTFSISIRHWHDALDECLQLLAK